MIYFIAYTMVFILAYLLFFLKVEGKEHRLKGQGVVLCSNHISMLDPVFVEVAWGGYPKFAVMGKGELFKNPLLAFLFRSVGVFPVDRGAADTQAVEKAIEGVQSGRGLLICPEGTRSKDGKLGKLKTGAFVVALQTGAPIVPCCVVAKGGKVRLFKRVKVVFGPPIMPAEMLIPGERKAATIRRAKTLLRSRFLEILGPDADGQAGADDEEQTAAVLQPGVESDVHSAPAKSTGETAQNQSEF